MRFIIFFLIILFNQSIAAKEWQSIKCYQKIAQSNVLLPSDWLKSDRTSNTVVWQKANHYNLKNNLHQEYINIVQRRDFYKWLSFEIHKKGHEVVWINMAHFISKKMHLMEVFPYSMFSKKEIKSYGKNGSEIVFKKAFNALKTLFYSETILKTQKALAWDKKVLHKEQFLWIDSIYKTMDSKNLKILERIAKRKFLYTLVVPKVIEFKGNLSKAEARYNYAVEILRPYCKKVYK